MGCGRCGSHIHAFSTGLAGLERILTPNAEVPFVRCVKCGWDLRTAAGIQQEAPENTLLIQSRHDEWLEKLNPDDYFWVLNHAVSAFAGELGTLPFACMWTRHRAEVLQRAAWLLDGDRWRYIQSVCGTPRPPMGVSAARRKPAVSEHRATAPGLRSSSRS